MACALTSCTTHPDSLAPVPASLPAPATIAPTPPQSGQTGPDSPDRPADEKITSSDRAAATVVAHQFQGTSIDNLSHEEITKAGQLACTLADPGSAELYDPEVLRESMRQAYSWFNDEREALIVPGLIENYCPDLHPGDDLINELIDSLTPQTRTDYRSLTSTEGTSSTWSQSSSSSGKSQAI